VVAVASAARVREPRHERGWSRRTGPALAGQPAHRALHDDRGAHLAVLRFRDAPDARWAAGHSPRTARGGRDRRGERVADDVAHHDTAARPDHQDLYVLVHHRLAATVRPGVDHDPGRPGQRVGHDADLHGPERLPE